MTPFIFSCGCGDTDKFAIDAFRLLFHGQSTPPIVHPGGRIPGSSGVAQVVHAYKKNDKPFALYIRDEGVWDLLKGRRVQ